MPIFSDFKNLLGVLGNPQDSLPPIIHVAGTNGKGSTIAFMAALLQEAGLDVHTYTSPHLYDPTERIGLNGQSISKEKLASYLQIVQSKDPENKFGFFWQMTAAAFLAFKDSPAQVLLLETGIGGRFDATNVITSPIVCVITSLSYDHQEMLGNTIEAIAREKAGIFKKGASVVVGSQRYPVGEILRQKAREAGILEVDFVSEEQVKKVKEVSLSGDFQKENAATALKAVESFLIKTGRSPLKESKGKCALTNTLWPGRLELLQENPEIWIDGAHNEGGFQAIKEQIQFWKKENDKAVHVYIALSSKRNIKILEPLMGSSVDYITFLDVSKEDFEGYSFYTPSEILENLAREVLSSSNVDSILIEDLYKYIKKKNNTRNLITGSLYLMCKVRALILP